MQAGDEGVLHWCTSTAPVEKSHFNGDEDHTMLSSDVLVDEDQSSLNGKVSLATGSKKDSLHLLWKYRNYD